MIENFVHIHNAKSNIARKNTHVDQSEILLRNEQETPKDGMARLQSGNKI